MAINMTCTPTQTPHDIDIAALREKYRHERDKRLRPEGGDQYATASGGLADFADVDPHFPPTVREPLSIDTDVVIVGGGFSGLMAGARLKQSGVEDFKIIEWGADYGGVWYWNRYPGIQCDNESYCYFPLTEGPRLSAIDDATGRLLAEGMADPRRPVFVSTLRVTADAFGRRHPAVKADADGARIVRSVLMKPEAEEYLDELHDRVEELARRLES